eukprot:2634909-Rhodomonas_salina.3
MSSPHSSRNSSSVQSDSSRRSMPLSNSPTGAARAVELRRAVTTRGTRATAAVGAIMFWPA